jgi:NAD(P)-dependent dehydrogenase (short-subunit alcohol dehydrogenase family)
MSGSRRSILITGASGTLGLAFASHFFGNGFSVCAIVKNTASLERVTATLQQEASCGTLHVFAVDLQSPNAVDEIVGLAERYDCWPECLVNAARDRELLKLGPHGMPSRNSWIDEFLLEIVLPYELTMALAMNEDSKLKNVVNVSSQYGIVAANPCLYDHPEEDSPIHYSVAKAGVIHLTKELAVRLAPRGIRVNSISYGGVAGRVSESFQRRYAALCPSGKMLSVDDVSGPLDFLVSADSVGVTGHNLVVDGGWTAW